MIRNTSTTTANHLLPKSTSDDPYSAFYSGSGLPIRIVTAGELQQEWLKRAASIIYPGSDSAVYQSAINRRKFNKFQKGPNRVVTILKPDQ